MAKQPHWEYFAIACLLSIAGILLGSAQLSGSSVTDSILEINVEQNNMIFSYLSWLNGDKNESYDRTDNIDKITELNKKLSESRKIQKEEIITANVFFLIAIIGIAALFLNSFLTKYSQSYLTLKSYLQNLKKKNR